MLASSFNCRAAHTVQCCRQKVRPAITWSYLLTAALHYMSCPAVEKGLLPCCAVVVVSAVVKAKNPLYVVWWDTLKVQGSAAQFCSRYYFVLYCYGVF